MKSSGQRPMVFLSYARLDGAVVQRFANALSKLEVEVWYDVNNLAVGSDFAREIRLAVERADVFVFFASPAGLASDWLEQELLMFADRADRPLIPIFFDNVDIAKLPVSIRSRNGVSLQGTDQLSVDAAAAAVAKAARGLETTRTEPPDPQVSLAAKSLSEDLAADVSGRKPRSSSKQFDSVFVVHGHDEAMLDEVARFLTKSEIQPIVLSRLDETDVGDEQQSLFRKFSLIAGTAEFAVVLLSADDLGASRIQHDSVPDDRALKFRARQNVIFELGFFYGQLGWDSVVVLVKPAELPWPDFERPSDLDGVVFTEFDSNEVWADRLKSRLSSSGFAI